MDTKLKGDIAEQAAVLHALKHGWGVLKPVGDRLPYDLVFDISVPQHPNIKYATHDLLTCEECGEEEAIAFPDPTTKDGSVHCFLCHSRYSVEFCLNCPSIILSRIESGETIAQDIDKDFGEDDDSRLCDFCLEQIADRDY